MNKNKLVLLGLAALVLIGIASVISQQPEKAPTENLLFPELKSKLNDVTGFVVQTGGQADAKLSILRDSQGSWRLLERQNYFANTTELRKLLLQLAELKVIEEKTSNPDYYARLGVQDIADADEHTHLLQVSMGEAVLAELLIGKQGPGGSNYVRKPGIASSSLASARIELPTEANEWLQRDLLNIEKARIHRVKLSPVAKPAYELLAVDANADLQVVAQEESAVAWQKNKLASIARALEDLRFDDLASAEELASLSADWNVARFESFDGLVIETRTQLVADKFFMQVAVHYDASLIVNPLVMNTDTGSESAAPNDAAEASSADDTPINANATPVQRDVAAEASDLQARVDGYTFIVANYLQERLAASLSDLQQPATP